MKKVIMNSNETNAGNNKFSSFLNNEITGMNICKVKGGDDFIVEDLIDM